MDSAGGATPEDVIPRLRALMELHKLSLPKARIVADQQADLLRQLVQSPGPAMPLDVLFRLPGMHVEYRPDVPVPGLSWPTEPDHWRIVISGRHPREERRFSLLHEFKHVLDDPFVAHVYGNLATERHHTLVETVCEHFAGCFLMPAESIRRDWKNGQRSVTELAQRYGVSERAVSNRLRCLGLLRRQETEQRRTRGLDGQEGWVNG
jgi:hypothetical protein